MHIRAYLKPSCGWSRGVRAVFKKYGLEYEDLDIINNREIYAEMVQKSGQPLSPCVQIDDVMLADISGEEVEQYMLSHGLVKPTDATADAPTNASCTDAEHAQQAATAAAASSKTIRFF
jgi:monothiol glutaredoxin